MNTRRFLVTLTVINIGVLLLSVAQYAVPALAQEPVAVLRARALEIVDEQGRIRASLSVLPASTTAGAAYQGTVLLRLITEQGRPSIKLSASEQTSGLSIAGPTGTKDAYTVLEANATSSSLKLHAQDGREQILRP